MPLVDVGVRLIMDQFDTFQKNQEAVNRSVQSMTQSMEGMANMINNKLSPANLMLGNALGQYLVRGIDMAVNKIKALTVGSLDVAGRFQQLMEIAYLLAGQAGMTAAEVDKTVASIRSAGIEASVAADLLVTFARYELDLTKATDLARVAQDASQTTGENSSETLKRLTWGIQTYNSETFRTAGINISASNAFDTYGKTINKTAQQMTSAEKSQAILNAVLEEGKKIAGAYDASLGTAAKIWSSYARVANDLQIALGTPFLEASKQAGLALTTFTKSMTAAFETGGKLNPMLETLGAGFAAFFSLVNDGAKSAVDGIVKFFSGTMFNDLAGVLGQAAEWGFNLIASFAIGIASGITSVLAFALQAVGELIAFFLEAHSPPNIAPDIDKWGAGAMTAYLEGFKEADFSVLNTLSGTLRSALSGLGMSGTALEDTWKGLAGGMTKALASGNAGDITGRIRSSLGMYGNEVAELVEKQFALAKATKQVQDAEEALKKSREASTEAAENLSKIVSDYNTMAQTEKDPAKLAAKRQEFLLAKQAYSTAVAKEKTDAKSLETAKKSLDPIQKAAALQKELVDTLISLTKVNADDKKGGLGGLTKGIDDLKKSLGGVSNITESMKAKIEEFKTKLKDMFKPIIDSWNKEVTPNLDAIGKKIEEITKKLKDSGIMDSKGGINQTAVDIGKWVGGLWLTSKILTTILKPFQAISRIVTSIAAKVGALNINWGLAIPLLYEIGLIIGGIAFVVWALWTNWENVRTTIGQIGTLIGLAFKEPDKIFGPFFTDLKAKWDAFLLKLSELPGAIAKGDWAGAWEIVKTAFGDLGTGFSKVWEERVTPILDVLWQSAVSQSEKLFFKPLKEFWDGWVKTTGVDIADIQKKFTELWTKIKEGINWVIEAVNRLKTALLGMIPQSTLDWFKTAATAFDDTIGKTFRAFLITVNNVIKALTGFDFSGIKLPKIPNPADLLDDLLNPKPKPTWHTVTNPDTGEPEQLFYAKGGHMPGFGSYLVGEKGPEIFTPGGGGYVTPWSAVQEVIRSMGINMLSQRISPAMSGKYAVSPNYSRSDQRVYQLTMQTQMTAQSVRQGFETMRILGS